MDSHLPKQIVYAKNAAHQKFLDGFEGKMKGRSSIAALVVVEFIAGSKLRKEIETELGNPTYQANEWSSARDLILIYDRAIRAGVSAERLGHRVMPNFRRTFPELFQGKTVRDAFGILEKAYRENTTYGGVSPAAQIEPTRALVYRKNSPLPCDYFVGVINGLLDIFSVKATTREIECQWNGAPACCYETRWSK